jgi:hypothetical protein
VIAKNQADNHDMKSGLIEECQEIIADEIFRYFRQRYITPRGKESRYRLDTVPGTAPASILLTNQSHQVFSGAGIGIHRAKFNSACPARFLLIVGS